MGLDGFVAGAFMQKKVIKTVPKIAALCMTSAALLMASPALPVEPALPAEPAIPNSKDNALHVLNRLTFGPRPGDVEMVKDMGVEQFISTQLHPNGIAEDKSVSHMFKSIPGLKLSANEVYLKYGYPTVEKKLEKLGINDQNNPAECRRIKVEAYEAKLNYPIGAKVVAAVNSPRQLQEVMTDFWFNHFNVWRSKDDRDACYVATFEEHVIRPRVFGKFRDLLWQTCHHPAMIDYLDVCEDYKAGYEDKKGANHGLNENYARELMELHSLGADAGYTQKDVIELARILSGLTLVERAGDAGKGPGYYFDRKRHDFGDKVFLGHSIKGSGEREIDQALDILAFHPATAHHISYQLAQYFVCDEPPPQLVTRLAQKFSQSHGDIRAVLSQLFHSPEFWDERYRGSKFKSPYRYVISTIRGSGIILDSTNIAQTADGKMKPLERFFIQQGQPIYGCKTPDGYKNTQDAWLSANSLVQRINFSIDLAAGKLKLNGGAPIEFDRLKQAPNLSAKSLDIIGAAAPETQSAMVLSGPDAMRY